MFDTTQSFTLLSVQACQHPQATTLPDIPSHDSLHVMCARSVIENNSNCVMLYSVQVVQVAGGKQEQKECCGNYQRG